MKLFFLLALISLSAHADKTDDILLEAKVLAKFKEISSQPKCESWKDAHEWSDRTYAAYGLEKIEVKHTRDQIKIAVIDTGINLQNEVILNSIPKKYRDNLSQLDFTNRKLGLNDLHSHGSHVTGVIIGLYPQAQILPLKYTDMLQNGWEDSKSFIKAMNFAIKENVDIINYSAGGEGSNPDEEEVIKAARAKGILVIVSAGNEKTNLDDKKVNYYPASYNLENLIVVGSHKKDSFETSKYSNFGPRKVDFMARGDFVESFSSKCTVVSISGTSMATPFVTATLALLKVKYPSASNETLLNHLHRTSTLTPDARLGAINLPASMNLEFQPIQSIATK